MANHGRKFARALALAALCLLLGGCATNVSTDKLYALPSLPAEYASLEAEINALLSDGAEHAAGYICISCVGASCSCKIS
mgnify:CR=1 FL=1